MSIADKLTTIAQNMLKVYQAGIDQGNQQYEEMFWKSFSNNGKRARYERAFNETDFSGISIPIGLIRPTSGISQMFYNYMGTSFPTGVDLSGVSPNLTATYGGQVFSWANHVTEIPDMGLPAMDLYYGTYSICRKVQTIEVMRVHENTRFESDPFNDCRALQTIRIEGIIGQSGLSFQYSTKLSKESITGIVNALSSTAEGKSITFSQTSVNNAFETAEWNALAASKANWTISLI